MYSFRCSPSAAMAAAFLSMVCTAAAPPGWFLAGNRPQDYTTGVDAQASYAGQPSAYLKSTKPQIDGFGTLMQQFKADDYLGKRIRFSAFVKTDAVAGWCALWTRVDKGTQSVAFDNMQDRAIKGTTAWQTYEIVLDVAPDATGIAFGILIDGTGTAWMSGAKLDVVGTNVPTTGPSMAARQGPQNLALEATAAGKPRAWFLAGSKPRSYSVGVETGSGAYLKSTDLEIDGFGTLMQGFLASDYAGKRIRFSASVKTDSVAQWCGLWTRVDKGTASVAFDNMQDRPIKGTLGWSRYAVVLDVPQDATAISIGILLDGTGQVWLKDVAFEIVGSDVSVTGSSAAAKPTNLGFEK